MKAFSQRTNADIFIEYKNDWLTVGRMAENYNRTEAELNAIIDKGREEHERNVEKTNRILYLLALESESMSNLDKSPADWQQAREELEQMPAEQIEELIKQFEQ